jgi:type II secretory ATPase GspE/PulE/Tfp pilus assembly ATPase PilB-like protein
MPRCLTFLFALLIVAAVAGRPGVARAQAPASSAASSAPAAAPAGTWPIWINDKAPEQFSSKNFERGPGFYFSIIKLGCSALLFFLWLAVCDWINRDIRNFSQLHYRVWNVVAYAPFAIAFLLQFVIPWYALSLALMIPAVVAPLTVYVRKRNQPLAADERVFTPLHLRQILAEQLKPLGIKISAQPRKKGLDPPITLQARGAPSAEEGQKREIAVRQSQGQAHVRDLILKSIGHRASGIMLDYSADAVTVKFLIDGVWLDGEPLPRLVGDPVLVSLKTLCGLRPDDRRTRQVGTFTAVEDATKKKILAKLTSQGTKSGERALIQYDDPSIKKRRLPDYSLRPKVLEDLQSALTAKKGLFVISAAPGVGLTSLTTACLAAIDRYTRSVMSVEDKQSPDVEVENVQITTYDSLEQENPMTKLPSVIRQFPDVIFVPDMVNAETATFLCEEAISEDRLIVTTSRARDAVEGLLQPAIATKAPLKKYAAAATGSIAQKLVRKLCDTCKEAYPPQPQILQKLGIPPDKVGAFYRPPTQQQKEVCKNCAGLGYKDQIAIVELLVVDDLIRQTMLREPKVETIRSAARKQGMKTFEDEGLMLVVKGITSVAELSRVLKEGAQPAAPATSPAGAPPAGAPTAGPAVAKPAAAAPKPASKPAAQPPPKPGAPPQKRPGT